MFRKTMSTSDAITLFDAGAGQVSITAILYDPYTDIVLIKDQTTSPREVENTRRIGAQ